MSWLAEFSAETWLSRDVSHFKMLTIVLRQVCMIPHKWRVRTIPLTTVPLSTSCRKRTSGLADASPGLKVTGDVVLVKEFSGGADGHGHEGDDETKKGRRGQGPRPPQRRLQWRGWTVRFVFEEKRASRGIGARDFFFYRRFETDRCGLLVASPADSHINCYVTSSEPVTL